jgi:methyl-accepting chemotaxis protein
MLYTVLALLGVLLVALSVYGGLDALARWDAAARAQQVNMATDLLLESAHEIVEQRDEMRLAGLGEGHAHAGGGEHAGGGGMHAVGDDHAGGHGDSTFGPAMQQLHKLKSYQGREALMDAVHQTMREFDALRTRMESARQEEMGELSQAWTRTSTKLLKQIEELRLTSARTSANGNAAAGDMSMPKHFTSVIIDYASRERVAMAELIADDFPIPPNRLPELYSWRGRLELAWQALEEAGASGVGGTGVSDAVDRARREFFDAFEDVRRLVYMAGLAGESYPVDHQEWLAASAQAIDAIHDVQHAIVEASAEQTAAASKVALRNLLILTAILSIGLATLVFSVIVVARRVIGPVNLMTRAMTNLASGNVDVEIPAARRNDEIGQMARAVHVFRDNAMEKARLEAEQANAERSRAEERRSAMVAVADRFERSVKAVADGVSSAATEMQATAQQMSATAEESSRQSANVAGASDQAAANVQTVAATAEELSVSTTEIGRQVTHSAQITASAVAETEATNETVQGLAEAASKIGDVVKLINDIAGQTNLLALNATIEAARAGEAGKGFAVVAQEVKNLANQTAKATEEISQQVASIQNETSGAVAAIEKIRSIIGEVNDIATTIASAVEEQGASTQEIARNVQQAARGTQEVNENIAGVSGAAGETGAAAGQVLNAAQEMSRQAEQMRAEVDRFLGEVRAG